MPAASCSDDEFIAACREHMSASGVASALGIHERNVYARRRRIESRQKISLPLEGRAGHLYKYKTEDHNARHQVEIATGSAIVFSDAHFWPGVRTTAFRGLLKFIEEIKPELVVCNGDAFDGASISRYPRIGWDSKPSVQEELRCCKDRLGEIEEVAGGAKLVWPLGNHDARFENRLAQNASEFEGVKGFSLKDHFPEWKACWSVWVNDCTVIKHRWKGGVHATRNNTLNAGRTMVTGHLHSLKVTPLTDYNGVRWGVDTGTLADPKGPQFVDYLEDSPTDWRSGFVVLTYHKGRLLMPEMAQVFDEQHVEFRGHVIEVPR